MRKRALIILMVAVLAFIAALFSRSGRRWLHFGEASQVEINHEWGFLEKRMSGTEGECWRRLISHILQVSKTCTEAFAGTEMKGPEPEALVSHQWNGLEVPSSEVYARIDGRRQPYACSFPSEASLRPGDRPFGDDFRIHEVRLKSRYGFGQLSVQVVSEILEGRSRGHEFRTLEEFMVPDIKIEGDKLVSCGRVK